MAETQTQPHPQPKRHHEDDVVSSPEPSKRHRTTYINDQQETTTQELLDLFTSLSSDQFVFNPQPEPDTNDHNTSSNAKEFVDDYEDDEKERVMRHLLEASDDELGIPSRVFDDDDVSGGGGGGGGDVTGGGFPVGLCDGLWEIEDEAANYYTLLQCELFMQ